MQNKGVIRLFTVLMILICIYQLSFTLVTSGVEKDAREFAQGEKVKNLAKELAKGDVKRERELFDSLSVSYERYFLDSVGSEVAYNLGIRKYTYKECKEKEINLGLDLKGGMNVTLEVSMVDIVKSMSNNSQNVTFNKAIAEALEMQKNSQEDYITLFGQAFEKIDPNAKLAAPDIFSTRELREKGITPQSSNKDVLKILHAEGDAALDRTFNILRNRIDKFGVAQPNIQQLSTKGRILVELPGVKDPSRARKILQTTAELQFWLTYENKEVYGVLESINKKLKDIKAGKIEVAKTDSTSSDSLANTTKVDSTKVTKADTTTSLIDKVANSKDTNKSKLATGDKQAEFAKENPLFSVLSPNVVQEKEQYFPGRGPAVGYVAIKDTAKVNKYLALEQVKNILPRDLRFAWTNKPIDKENNVMQLIALKATNMREGSGAALSGDKVVDAYQDYGQNGQVEVMMAMNNEGAAQWKRLTGDHIGESVAIVLDGYVYSFPNVNDEIPNGRSSISGNFTVAEAKDLANVLKAGKLPAPARIVEEGVVGPSLGQESINAGFLSFFIAFIAVMLYMFLYYNKAGLSADLSLFINLLFIIGILASLQAVLTLPGIAGIVLTMGMAVDGNVVIYERIREELRAGKGLRLAVQDGFKHAYAAIIDGNVTTLLTGIVLLVFGTGAVQGFATTLIIGIFTTLFTSIFITRLNFEWMLNKNKNITFAHSFTEKAFLNANFDFIGKRKIFYAISLIITIGGIISLATRGLDLGVDFTGGRTYIVRFNDNVSTTDLAKELSVRFGSSPEVKMFGTGNQVKITTKYMIDSDALDTDKKVEETLFEGIKTHLPLNSQFADFKENNLLSSQKVGPTVADDVVRGGIMSVFFALIIIFLYVLLRFNKWEYSFGAVVALFHDATVVLSIFSIFHGILPFTMEIDQAFIAAILTVIGASIYDTVIIFDRIREYSGSHKKDELPTLINRSLNSTLGRTFNASFTTLLTLLVMFILGGDVIRGFMFALLTGIAVGSYSSWFVATPLYYDTHTWSLKRKAKKEMELAKKK